MDVEFHYYITYILARKGGYSRESAAAIAYASQYTDDNNDMYRVKLPGGRSYRNFISQTMDIFHPKSKKIHIYTCFHFFPGDYSADTARRNDGVLHIFNTTPDSANARRMFRAAMDSGDLCRIGIAAHCYADTWGHQNFVGVRHVFNKQKGLLPRLLRIPIIMLTPSIGHADFQEQPDIPNLQWTDRRLLGPNRAVDNKQRFMAASREIFRAFAARNGLKNIEQRWEELAGQLSSAIGEGSSSVAKCRCERVKRIEAYRAICPEMPEYCQKKWLDEAATPTVGRFIQFCDRMWLRASSWMILGFDLGVIVKNYWPKWMRMRMFTARPGFMQSDWLRFQEAVKAHQWLVLNMLLDRYQQIGAGSEKVLRMIEQEKNSPEPKSFFAAGRLAGAVEFALCSCWKFLKSQKRRAATN